MTDTDEIAALRAENERLRAALQDVYMTTRCDKTAAKALAALGFTPVPNGQTALSSWRPIDQPPIHPMRVLLFSPDQYDANWNGADYGIRVAYFANGHWRDQGTNHDACEFDTPTHWMPLPPAPGKEVK